MKIEGLEDAVIVHYGCSNFANNEHKIFWIGAVYHKPNKQYFFENGNEIDIIEKFYAFCENNNHLTFLHWSMNSPKFGFKAISRRYKELTGKSINLCFKKEIDLSEYLKSKYGLNYVSRNNGRLNNLAELNSFSGIQSEIEVINLNDATNRLELIFSIVQVELHGELKTSQNEQFAHHIANTHEKQKPKLKQTQIALIYAYKNDPITRDNGDEIAKKHGYTSKTSGEKLYQCFNKYYNAFNRKGDEGTKRKNQSKIKRIESVLYLLPNKLKERAKDEIETLKNTTNANYS